LEGELNASLQKSAAAESNIESLDSQLADSRRKIQEVSFFFSFFFLINK